MYDIEPGSQGPCKTTPAVSARYVLRHGVRPNGRPEGFGLQQRYVWRLGRQGALPQVRAPGRKYVRFCEADVGRFIAEGRQAAVSMRRSLLVAHVAAMPAWLPTPFRHA